MRASWFVGGVLLVLGGVACGPSPYVRDPGCRAAYDHCVSGCPLGPPEAPFGAEHTPSLEQACLNGCYTDARACQSRVKEREEEALPPPPRE